MKEKLEHFKQQLLKQRQQILNLGLIHKADDLLLATEDLSDEADVASSAIRQQLHFAIRDREYVKLRRIDAALARIEDGSYGLCEECEEEIGHKRLENQSWVELCIQHAEEKEREEAQMYRQA